jgi:sulfatase modifying factor 1
LKILDVGLRVSIPGSACRFSFFLANSVLWTDLIWEIFSDSCCDQFCTNPIVVVTDALLPPRRRVCLSLKGLLMVRLPSRTTTMSMLRFFIIGIVLFANGSLVRQSRAGIVTFGTGANQFQMEFVTIGNPGNVADTTGAPNPAGSVAYAYQIGKYEVATYMINRYNRIVGKDSPLRIEYDYQRSWKPVTGITWRESSRFVNWLNTDLGGTSAYKFDTEDITADAIPWTPSDSLDYDPNNPFRSKRATFVLPSDDEWYKAAFYDPDKNNGEGGYWRYPTGSNIAPIPVSSGRAFGTAVYAGQNSLANYDQAGGLSRYGVMALGGNVEEWVETLHHVDGESNGSQRYIRNGNYEESLDTLNSFSVRPDYSFFQYYNLGFRVVRLGFANDPPAPPPPVPEPSSLVIGTLFSLGGLLAKRRMKR